MKVWQERPTEVANLFNPPFSATLLGYASQGFAAERSGGLPWVFAFLLFPLILHKATREVAPKTKATKFQTWVERNPAILFGFAERARHMVPHVREGIMFGANVGILVCKDDATLLPGPIFPKKEPTFDSEEVKDCMRRARTLGAVLANGGTEHTVFAILGVRA